MSQLENIASYWNQRSQGYSDTIHHEMENGTAEYYAEKLRKYAPEGKELKCLDVGCGPALFSILLSKEGHHVTSMDYSPGMLEKAEANLKEAGFEPDLVRGDVTKLPFEAESYDYIVSRNLVWNLEHPAEAYKEWLRVLKPGGHILVIDANHYLHYYNAQYKKMHDELRKHAEQNYGHVHMQVDPTPIDEIARDLPLSREIRPEWDMGMFRELGVTVMQIETRPGWYHRETDKDQKLIGEFFICAEK